MTSRWYRLKSLDKNIYFTLNYDPIWSLIKTNLCRASFCFDVTLATEEISWLPCCAWHWIVCSEPNDRESLLIKISSTESLVSILIQDNVGSSHGLTLILHVLCPTMLVCVLMTDDLFSSCTLIYNYFSLCFPALLCLCTLSSSHHHPESCDDHGL